MDFDRVRARMCTDGVRHLRQEAPSAKQCTQRLPVRSEGARQSSLAQQGEMLPVLDAVPRHLQANRIHRGFVHKGMGSIKTGLGWVETARRPP
jgi:hypothetical protein